MKRITRNSFRWSIAAAILACLCSAAVPARGQSPLFPNTSPVYNNPYGAPASTPNGPFYRGVQFPLRQLPEVYNRPLPAPPPSVMAQFGTRPYNYGANSNVRVFSGTLSNQPTRQRNWAPNFSSR